MVRSLAWDYGDGTHEEITSATAAHTYPAANSYTVVALVTDTDGHATSIRNVARVLPVSPLPPTPNPNPTPTPNPTPVFTRSGTGASVFDLPASVTRIRVTGDYQGFCENFFVDFAGRSLVITTLGTCSIASGAHFEGSFATSGGGLIEITRSTGVTWSVTEVR